MYACCFLERKKSMHLTMLYISYLFPRTMHSLMCVTLHEMVFLLHANWSYCIKHDQCLRKLQNLNFIMACQTTQWWNGAGQRRGHQDGCYNSLLAEAAACPQQDHSAVIIIIMYIYHALINTLSAHIIYINLNVRQLKRAARARLSWTKYNLTEGFLVLFLSWCTQTRCMYTNTVCVLLTLLFANGNFVEILHQSKTIFIFFLSLLLEFQHWIPAVSAVLYCY